LCIRNYMVDKTAKSLTTIHLGNKNSLVIFEVLCLLYKRYLVCKRSKWILNMFWRPTEVLWEANIDLIPPSLFNIQPS